MELNYNAERAIELLRIGSGNVNAAFRENQEAAIQHVVEGRGRLLVVQKTGWGKSFVYFIATKLLRESGEGPALLVSPLLSLMRNQVSAAEQMGVRAETINSDNEDEWSEIEKKIKANDVDILIVSPERLSNQRFRAEVLPRIAANISLLVVDEAHCISDWGHDFRPQYRLLERTIKQLTPNMRILATTATANDRVSADLAAVLGPDITVFKGDLNRSSLTLQTITLPNQAERLAWLADKLKVLPGSGIIYTLTVRDANQVAKWLRKKEFVVESYTGQTGDRRELLEDALLNNDVKALVATTSLGMGYDKPDLAFVIHYQMPGSVVAYYQQVGRAGRSIPYAYGVLLSGKEESQISEWFINSAFPTEEEVTQVLSALEASEEPLSIPDLMREVNLGKGRIAKTIESLALEIPAPVIKVAGGWQLTANELSGEFRHRANRLTTLRREELEQMKKYVQLPFGEHMGFLVRALDGDLSLIAPPSLKPLDSEFSEATLKEAVEFLSQTNLPIESRKMWPPGGLPTYGLRGKIPPHLQAFPGQALCYWGDAGWGAEVKNGRYVGQHFSDRLVEACANMFHSWSPEPRPTWVTAIPSLRHPDLVPGFAKRLAKKIGLPYLDSLVKVTHTHEQKSMANSTKQALNVDGSLEIEMDEIPQGPVLLIDDIVNSRWTITVAAWLLRNSDCDGVYPLALSITGQE
ncbi:RecQ-like ATP-dependent DNA helicase [Pseudomonas sp. 478]|uniref:RecQ family ATP-dependent DNA helicase n=1 Tax=unclassified Pseudomonas TaxID=196821 RepID=UPI000DB67D6F|nr:MULTISPECIES: RecQ family ATP-dependent DNA helicase [unclassified Pseudomonas]PZW99342.1 RecQ-like ATP-dependent DNA helicase [Pseudomonas sp. 478]TCV49116.1 RecQ-like ATP-dependent DNA helicase [Pseudomonas sp. 460]